LFEKFLVELIVTLMNGSQTARLKDPRFIQAFNRLFGRFLVELIVTIMSGSLTARLMDRRFI